MRRMQAALPTDAEDGCDGNQWTQVDLPTDTVKLQDVGGPTAERCRHGGNNDHLIGRYIK
ncbi:MAG: hypothetical protein GX279_05355 [Clostridiaceae bacterium]|nr:hypothetical protein [Clostridiaceae bacterium]